MCFRLYLASPLTLSEIRSMLPEGVTAELLNPSLQRFYQDQSPRFKTAVLLLRGACSCDLAGRRHPDQNEDERALRTRYRREGVPRNAVITALERHRVRPRWPAVSPEHWSAALAGFVAEHARNAGAALYALEFTPEMERIPAWSAPEPRKVRSSEVVNHPAAWLAEGTPLLVTP